MTVSGDGGEVLTQAERRRRWTVEQKLEMVTELMRPGASPTQVARRYGITTGLLYTWRRQAMTGKLSLAPVPIPTSAFVPVEVKDDAPVAPPAVAAEDPGIMVIELACDRHVRVDRHVDIAALRRVLAALERR